MATPAMISVLEAARTLDQTDGRGYWKANQLFDLRNLRCLKGERLPPRWQNQELIKYLRDSYGDDCVTFVPARPQRPRPGRTAKKPAAPATPPEKAAKRRA